MSSIDLRLGDCLEVLKSIPDNSIDLIVTDPPYLIDAGKSGGAFGTDKRSYHKDVKTLSDGITSQVLDESVRVLKKPNIYLWCNKNQLRQYIDYFEGIGCTTELLTWHKTNPVPACGNKYLTDTEFILFFRQKGVKVHGSFNTKRTWYATPLNQKDKKIYGHPTIKPLEIIENLVINSSLEGGQVLDPFMGSGTTGAACKHLRRNFIGIEIDQNYFATAKERIEKTDDESDRE